MEGFILHHEMLPHENPRAQPLQDEGYLEWAHTHIECCRQGEGRALGRVLPACAQHMRDCVGSHPLTVCPMLAKRSPSAPLSPGAAQLNSWIQSSV